MLKTLQLYRTGSSIAKSFQDQNAWLVFLVLVLGYEVAYFIQDHYIITKEVYYNTLGEQLTTERIDEYLSKQAKWKIWSYVIIPVSTLLQTVLITICINCGTIVLNYEAGFKSIFKVVLKSSLVFLIFRILLTVIYLSGDVKLFDDLTTLNKFALSGFIEKDALPVWLMYPLSVINIFEIAFWLLLAWGMSEQIKKPFTKALSFVGATYGVGLCMWMLFVVFLTLNFS